MKQRTWRPFGWNIMLTSKQGFGIGFWMGCSWLAIRCNGVDLLLGPFTLTFQPPRPKWLLRQMQEKQPATD